MIGRFRSGRFREPIAKAVVTRAGVHRPGGTRALLGALICWVAGGCAAAAAPGAAEQLVKQFDGHYSLTTADFQVPDGWEIRWRSDQVLSVGVIRLDNTVVAGATGRNVGSLFVPVGGTYRIRVKGRDPIPWDVSVYALGPVTAAAPNGTDDEITFYVPTPGPGFKPPPPVVPAKEAPLAVVAPSPPPIPTELTDEQLRSVVTVKGDRTQGAGFLVKKDAATVVVTTLGLLSNNPNLEIDTPTGTKIAWTQIQGAVDRDLAMISIKNFGFPPLNMGNIADVQSGDLVLTTGTNGTPYPPEPVVSVGPQRIEVNRLRALNGAPVVLARTGRVIGVVCVMPTTALGTSFNDASFAEREAERNGSMTAGALRFDNVPGWESYAWDKLQTQTAFLDLFRKRSRCLDSYLNGDDEEGSKLWQSDDKIKSANDTFVQDTAGGDPSQRTEALHGLLFELGVAADADMDQIGVPANFYAYERKRAHEQMAYRQALKAQLDNYGSDVSRFNSVANRNN